MTKLQFHSNSLLHLAKCSLLDYWQKKLFRFNRSSAVENRFRAFFFLCFRRFCPCPQPFGAPCPNVSRVNKSPANIRIWPRNFEFQDLRISGRKQALVISSLKVWPHILVEKYVATWTQIKSWMSYRSWGLRCAKRLWRRLSSSFPSHRDALTTGLVKKSLVCFVSWLPFSSSFEMPFSLFWSSGLAELLDCLLFPCLWNASTTACSFSYLFANSVFENFLSGAAADKKPLANGTSSFMLDDWQLCDWNDNYYPSIKYSEGTDRQTDARLSTTKFYNKKAMNEWMKVWF